MKEITGVYFHMEAVSPEAARAQMMAEVKNVSTYRAKRLQQYKDWSDPVKRAEKQAKQKQIEEESRKQLSSIDAEKVAVRTGDKPIKIKDA